jgi:CheY-like chemotaxis protein
MNEKKLHFQSNLDPALPKTIISDEQRLSQIIIHLLSNAVKFTPPEGNISLELQRIASPGEKGSVEHEFLRIQVRDSGIGISPEHKKSLFDLFEQGEGDYNRKHEGIGLGLNIVKNIAMLMGGDISVESELRKGSVFTVDVRMDVRIEEGSCSKEDSQQDVLFPEHYILLAEDVELNREIILALLENSGLKIECAENGIQAVKKYEESPEKYSIIFMDIHMPEMDGYEAARRIRAIEAENKKGSADLHEIPIFAMTANVFREDVEKCLAMGMNEHLGKPIEFEKMMKLLTQYLIK